jgi:sugar phosphate permease
MLRRPPSRAHEDAVPTGSGRGAPVRTRAAGGGLPFGAVRAPARRAGRIHYAWVVVGVTFLALLCAAAFRSSSSVLIVPLQDEFGWSRATISVALSINLLLFGLGGPFAAALMERFGIRRVMCLSLVVVGAAAALTVLIGAPWQLDLLWGVVIGLGTGAVSVPLAALVANRWFTRRRGLAVGLLTAANATGQLIFLPLLAWVAGSLGWRWVGLVVALTVAAVVPLVALLMRDRPRDVGLGRYGEDEVEPEPMPAKEPLRAAVGGLASAARLRDFWLLAAAFFVCGASTSGLIGMHLIPAAHDHGIGEVPAASLLALIGVFDIVGTTVSGWLTDRADPRRLLFAYYGLRGLSLFFLPYALDVQQFPLIAFVVFYGLDWVATVPPTVALTAQVVGRERVAVTFGWIFAAHQLGGAVAAWAAGASRTWLGSYAVAFMGAGLLCLVAAALSLRVGRPGRARRAGPAEVVPVEM